MRIKEEDHGHTIRLFNNEGVGSALNFLLSKRLAYQHRDTPRQFKSAYLGMVGKYYSMLGNYDMADHNFDLSVAACSENIRPWLEMADSYMRRGNLPQAGKTLLDLTDRKVPVDLEFEMTKLTGRYFKLEGDYEQAKQVYAEPLQRLPKTSVLAKDSAFIDKLMTLSNRSTYRIEGTLDYAFHLRRHKIQGGSSFNIATTFLSNRLLDVKQPEHRAALLAALSEMHFREQKFGLAKQYNDAAFDLDQKNPRTLGNRLSLLLLTGTATQNEVRSMFASERPLIMKDAKVACSLARVFHLAGMDDLTRLISKKLMWAESTPDNVRESADIMLHSAPVRSHKRA